MESDLLFMMGEDLRMGRSSCSLKGVIFDADGTLYDSEQWHQQAFNQAFREYNLDWHWDASEYKRLLMISGGLERMIAYAREHPDADSLPDNWEQWIAEVHKRKSDIYRKILQEQPIVPRPGILRLLKEISAAGLQMAVASSSHHVNIETALRRCEGGLLTYFDRLITADEVKDKKPSPAVYREALSVLNLSASECIAIEDTQSGCVAALAADLHVIITTHALTKGRSFVGASLVVDHMGEPDQPFVVQSGAAFGHSFLDLALLQKILAAH